VDIAGLPAWRRDAQVRYSPPDKLLKVSLGAVFIDQRES